MTKASQRERPQVDSYIMNGNKHLKKSRVEDGAGKALGRKKIWHIKDNT
jgi:hypothetical protein